jgi:CubicO group peptidase (beta-lactamase class C family)
MKHCLAALGFCALSTAALAQAPAPALPPSVGWQEIGLMQGFPPAEDKRVTRLNWLKYPNTVYSLQHIRELFPTRLVSRGMAPLRPLPNGKPLKEFTFRNDKGQDSSFLQFQRDTYADAILVLHKGKIVYERYDHGMTPTTPHLLFSSTKSFVGLIAQMLVSDGKLNETARVGDIVPELKDGAFGGVTVRDVMDMRTGIKFDENYLDPKADIHAYMIGADFYPAPAGVAAPRNLYQAMTALKDRVGPAGDFFNYQSVNTDVLAWILRKTTGRTISDLVSDMIWKPIGAEQDAAFLIDPLGAEVGSAGLNIVLRDFARFGQMLAQGGQFRGKQIVSKAAMDAITKGGDPKAFNKVVPQPTRPGWAYRSQFWMTNNENGGFWTLGVGGQRLYVDPKNQLVVAKFSSHPVPGNAFTDKAHEAAYAALLSELTKKK